MSEVPGVTVGTAPHFQRPLLDTVDLTQVVDAVFARKCGREQLGIAMAANRPMMATTIIISTSVKPAVLFS